MEARTSWRDYSGYSAMYQNLDAPKPIGTIAQQSPTRRDAGLTLVELLIAMAIMGTMAAMVAGLSQAATSGWQYGQGHADATQHARVALERIARTVREAWATPDFPGCAISSSNVGSWRFPDTLVVWSPNGLPVNVAGPPLVNECVFYCPDPVNPQQLVEIRAPTDTRTIPLGSELSLSTWQTEIAAIKIAPSSTKVVLTDLLRTSENAIGLLKRGAIRFERELRPSESEWTAYQGTTISWTDMSWPQDLFGSTSGTRHVWIRVELQLMPGYETLARDPAGQQAVVFFDSADLIYTLSK